MTDSFETFQFISPVEKDASDKTPLSPSEKALQTVQHIIDNVRFDTFASLNILTSIQDILDGALPDILLKLIHSSISKTALSNRIYLGLLEPIHCSNGNIHIRTIYEFPFPTKILPLMRRFLHHFIVYPLRAGAELQLSISEGDPQSCIKLLLIRS